MTSEMKSSYGYGAGQYVGYGGFDPRRTPKLDI
jgi:hypothetical protein